MIFIRWFIFICCLNCSMVFANPITIAGTLTRPILAIQPHTIINQPTITLLRLHVSAEAKALFQQRVHKTTAINRLSMSDIYPSVQLGMNNVPVLNQGGHGTCVTFASTAAIDAAINQGDYISQLCQLQLGQYLAENSYSTSGWNGSWGPEVLHQMEMFGVISKAKEQQNACGALAAYPVTGPAPDEALSLTDYHPISENLNEYNVHWSSLLDESAITQDKIDTNTVLNNIKQSLSAGDRLTVGILLFNYEQGIAGAIGTHKVNNDTWILTPEMIDKFDQITNFAGHEMIITGYDDQATAIDPQGRIYQGLFTLRNSWSEHIGDHGDFYISYSYMQALMLEVQRIRSQHNQEVEKLL